MASNGPTWADHASSKNRKFSVAWDDESWDQDPVLEDIQELGNKPSPRKPSMGNGKAPQSNSARKRSGAIPAPVDSEHSTEKESNSEFDRSTASTGASTPLSSVKDDEPAGEANAGQKAIVDDRANYCRDDELWRLQSALGTVDWGLVEGEKWETIQSKNNLRAAKEQQEGTVRAPRAPRGPRKNRNSNNAHGGNLNRSNNGNDNNKRNNIKLENRKQRGTARVKPTEKQPKSQAQVVKDSKVKHEGVDVPKVQIEQGKIQALNTPNPKFHNFFDLLHDVTKDGNLKPHAQSYNDSSTGSTINLTNKPTTPITTEKTPRKRNRRKHKYVSSKSIEAESLPVPEDTESPSKTELEETPLVSENQKVEVSDLAEDKSSPASTNCSASTFDTRLLLPIIVGIFIGYLLNM